MASKLSKSLVLLTRRWSDLQSTVEDLLVRSPGDGERWRLPTTGILSGVVDYQPLPPCMANMCNASGECTIAVKMQQTTNFLKAWMDVENSNELRVLVQGIVPQEPVVLRNNGLDCYIVQLAEATLVTNL